MTRALAIAVYATSLLWSPAAQAEYRRVDLTVFGMD